MDFCSTAYGQSSRLARKHEVHSIIMQFAGWLLPSPSPLPTGYCRLCVRDRTICTLLFAKLWHCIQCCHLARVVIRSLRTFYAKWKCTYEHSLQYLQSHTRLGPLQCNYNASCINNKHTFGDNFYLFSVRSWDAITWRQRLCGTGTFNSRLYFWCRSLPGVYYYH